MQQAEPFGGCFGRRRAVALLLLEAGVELGDDRALLLDAVGREAAGDRQRDGVIGQDLVGIPAAAGRLLECVGLTVVFAALNVLAGAAGVLLARALTGRFWSMYVNTDSTILLLALAQAIVVQWWKAGGRRP